MDGRVVQRFDELFPTSWSGRDGDREKMGACSGGDQGGVLEEVMQNPVAA